jgi:hypothetical protein
MRSFGLYTSINQRASIESVWIICREFVRAAILSLLLTSWSIANDANKGISMSEFLENLDATIDALDWAYDDFSKTGLADKILAKLPDKSERVSHVKDSVGVRKRLERIAHG